ncbi:TetR/AcrR family transcriptional regulator [Pelagibacterium luteolum]|uniref:Transcriptional regulator, TetR family n=1 Tax=Pelagibacterium luteolum TaxID=440168 RepID=A0A1G7YID7_9HYPH|nr:TetR/AcrR family transcriptional regulator [Pelagibacterium luteolum]SDG96332.1 transcriptional regulator, TetR family [Pelagibacterium luteolum]
MPDLGKRARQKLERPREILEAAVEEFVRKGYMATRVEDVAKAVGVTKGTVYFYFETKEALFNAVIRHFAPVFETTTEVPADKQVAELLSESLTDLYARITRERRTREIFHLLVAEGRHFPQLLDDYFVEFLQPSIDRLKALLALGVKRGEFRANALEGTTEILLSPAVLANVWTVVFSDRRPIDHNKYLANYRDLVFHGLKSPR